MDRNLWTYYNNWPDAKPYKYENKPFLQVRGAWSKNKKRDEKKKHSITADNKFSSLKVYMRDILKSSLITSIPEITTTKSWIKRIIKIIVFLLCLIGFIYQTLNFLWLYLSYPTVVNVLISNPFEVIQPAVTICNRNRQRRTVICNLEDNECAFMPEENYCMSYPRNCPSFDKPFTGVPFINALIQNSWYWDEELEEAHNDSMISVCLKIVEGEKEECAKPYRQVPVVTSAGEPNICYAVESLWGSPDVEPDIYPNTFIIEMEINTQPEEYLIYTEPVLIQVAVHDRRRLANPYTEGYSLKAGAQYEATVSMTEKKLLPPPYDTNCTDYLKLWKENNGTGPLNDLMCIEYCKLNTLLEKGECIDKNVAYPHMEDLCGRGKVTTTSDIIENCTKSCENPCSDHTYEVRYEEVNNYDHVCKDQWCKQAKIKLVIYFKQFRVTKFQYQPKFESVEMFSYIGGYMGMWLGLSLVSLFDFLETVAFLFYYPIGHLRWKIRKKKTKPLNTFKGNPYFKSQMY